jgi:hypothetical protein
MGKSTPVFRAMENVMVENRGMDKGGISRFGGYSYFISGENPRFVVRFDVEKKSRVFFNFVYSGDSGDAAPAHATREKNGRVLSGQRLELTTAAASLGEAEAGETFEVVCPVAYNELVVSLNEVSAAMLDEELLADSVAQLGKSTESFQAKGARAWGRVTTRPGQIIFTTIPYESGWRAKVDGERIEIKTACDGAFVALEVPPGEHEVSLWYVPDGLVAGLALCAPALALLVFLTLQERKGCKKERSGEDDENHNSGDPVLQ